MASILLYILYDFYKNNIGISEKDMVFIAFLAIGIILCTINIVFILRYRLIPGIKGKMALTIDQNGLVDFLGYGEIPWNDIISVKIHFNKGRRFLFINVKNYEKYKNRTNNIALRLVSLFQYNNCVTLNTSYLKTGQDFFKIKDILEGYLKAYNSLKG